MVTLTGGECEGERGERAAERARISKAAVHRVHQEKLTVKNKEAPATWPTPLCPYSRLFEAVLNAELEASRIREDAIRLAEVRIGYSRSGRVAGSGYTNVEAAKIL